jgi:hypothetical protein
MKTLVVDFSLRLATIVAASAVSSIFDASVPQVIFSTRQDICVLRPTGLHLLFVVLFAVLSTTLSFPTNAAGKDSDATLTFVARPPQKGESGHETSKFGHAFLIIGLKTSGGVKEDIFGFYPASNNLKGMVKGPGLLRAEYRCGPNDDCGPAHRSELLNKLSEAKDSVTVPISLDERKTVYDEIKKWDSKSTIGPGDTQVAPSSDAEYRLTDNNCIDFIKSVASSLGYPTPDRSSFQTPTEFLAALKPLVAQEEKVRESQREAVESNARADSAEAKARQEEIRRQVGEAKEEDAKKDAADAKATAAQLQEENEKLRKDNAAKSQQLQQQQSQREQPTRQQPQRQQPLRCPPGTRFVPEWGGGFHCVYN